MTEEGKCPTPLKRGGKMSMEGIAWGNMSRGECPGHSGTQIATVSKAREADASLYSLYFT